MNYRVGMSNTMRKGVIPKNELNKTNFSIRAGGEIIKNLTLDAKIELYLSERSGTS